jgi:hypothetical protein
LKRFTIILILLSAFWQVEAQELNHKKDSVAAVMKDKFNALKPDSLPRAVDSASARINDNLDKLKLAEKKRTDSLNNIVKKYQADIRQSTAKLTAKLDSLQKSKKTSTKYPGKLDSLNSVDIDPASVRQVRQLQQEISDRQAEVDKIQRESSQKLQEKIGVLSKESAGKGNLPGDIKLPSSEGLSLSNVPNIPSAGLPEIPRPGMNTDPKLPALDIPAATIPDKGLTTGNMPDIGVNDKLPELKSLPGDQLNGSIQAPDVSALSEKAEGYVSDVKDVRSGDLDKVVKEEEVINQLPAKDEVKMLQEQEKTLQDEQAKLASYKHPEEYKKQTILRGRQMAAVQFAAYGKQVQEAVSKVSSYQQKAGTLLGKRSELPKKRDPLKQLKTFEKFVPGVMFQVITNSPWLVDVMPTLRYRLTSYWSIGVGWKERMAFGGGSTQTRTSRIFGPSAFTEIILFKGVSFRFDVESMNFYSGLQPGAQDSRQLKTNWGYAVGAKKDFSVAPRVYGNVQFMYNVFMTTRESMYPSRFNVRFGFEYKLKKRKKSK